MAAFTIGFPIGIHRTLFFDIGKFKKQQEKSGFPSRNQKYVVFLISNNLWRLVCTGQMVRGTNFISGSPPLISSAKSLNSVTCTYYRVSTNLPHLAPGGCSVTGCLLELIRSADTLPESVPYSLTADYLDLR